MGRCGCGSSECGCTFASSADVLVSGTGAPGSPLTFDLVGLPLIPCTSGARPASPATGQPIYETDTGVMRYWSGARWLRVAGYPRKIGSKIGGPAEPTPWQSSDNPGLWYKVNDPATGGNGLIEVTYIKEAGSETILRYDLQGTIYYSEGPSSPGTNFSGEFGIDRQAGGIESGVVETLGQQIAAPDFGQFGGGPALHTRVDQTFYSALDLAPGSYTLIVITRPVTSATKVVFGGQNWLQLTVEEIPTALT